MLGLTVLESLPDLNDQRIDLITIVFKQELDLLRIQARSIELYIPQKHIGNIYVVVNDDSLVDSLIDHNWWGTNADRVVIINRSRWEIDTSIMHGWDSQQLYKLLAAEQATATWSLCLDAKTWFINTLEWNLLFDKEHKVKFNWFPVIPVFNVAKETLDNVFKVSLKDVIGPGGVPFAFKTSTVKSMIQWLSLTQNKDFSDFFIENVQWPYLITEFMLYSAYVEKVHSCYSALYNRNQYYTINNIAHNEAEQFDEKLTAMLTPNALTASIHRNAYQHLTDEQITQWVDFLSAKQLIADPENFRLAINTLQAQANNV